jgi:hypothetical protein
VQRPWKRGCCPENGVPVVVCDGRGGLGEALALADGPTVPEQRCIVHTRQHMSQNARPERTGTENQERCTQLRGKRPPCLQAHTAPEAHAGVARWAEPWREYAQQSVATLERVGVCKESRQLCPCTRVCE